MPVALAGGYVDTGQTVSVTMSGTFQVRMSGNSGQPIADPEQNPFTTDPNDPIIAQLNEWQLGGICHTAPGGGCPVGQAPATWSAWLQGPNSTQYGRLETQSANCTPLVTLTSAAPFSAAYGFTETQGPFRLGMKYSLTGTPTRPYFARNYEIQYALFGSEATLRMTSAAGFAYPTRYLQSDQTWGAAPAASPFTFLSNAPRLDILATGQNSVVEVLFAGLTIAGYVVDTTGLASGTLVGSGGGAIYSQGTPGGAAWADAPYAIRESCDIKDFAGTSMAVEVTDADGITRTTPYMIEKFRHPVSWSSPYAALSAERYISISPTWAAAQSTPLSADDLVVTTDADPPRMLGADYRPLTINVDASVNVQRPDGNRPSDWVSSDTNLMTVAEGPTDTVFEVETPGATATRTLASVWRDRVGLGTGGSANALFGIENYERTKHESGDDVWSWGGHGYLRCRVAGPSGTLALIVRGVCLVVTDPHTTGSGRTTTYMAGLSTVAFEATYSIPVTGESVNIDLLFPDEGGPFYLSRVDTLTLSGFKVGTYTLSQMELKAIRPAYLKFASGVETQGGDYSALGAALGGAFVFGNVPDQANKPEESGDYGGNPRYIQPLLGDPSGEILDEQYSLRDLWNKLEITEGWQADYSVAVHDAAMKDPYGAELGPELAQWCKPIVPYARVTPGTAYAPECAVVAGKTIICEGTLTTLYFRKRLWGGLEAQVVQDGGRAPAGATIGARRVGGSAIEATGTTDDDGFAVVAPVPANGLVDWELVEVP